MKPLHYFANILVTGSIIVTVFSVVEVLFINLSPICLKTIENFVVNLIK